MSETKLPKYRVIHAKNVEEFEAKLSTLADEGYTLASFNPVNEPTNLDETMFYAIVKLGENDYSDVVSIKDVAPELADEAIRGGLEPVSMSLSTKFIRMVRRKKI